MIGGAGADFEVPAMRNTPCLLGGIVVVGGRKKEKKGWALLYAGPAWFGSPIAT